MESMSGQMDGCRINQMLMFATLCCTALEEIQFFSSQWLGNFWLTELFDCYNYVI